MIKLLMTLLCFTGLVQLSESRILFPAPVALEKLDDNFMIGKKLDIVFDDVDVVTKKRIVAHFSFLQNDKAARLDDNELFLVLDPKLEIPKEGYRLEVTQTRIQVFASSEIGLFYASQSLKQLRVPVFNQKAIQGVSITDYPRFAWRGMHLDVSRHFYDVAFIKRYLDLMAMYKLNVFHWHLSDDDGWRLESKLFPKLTQLGSSGSRSGPNVGGGFYTQEDIKEIIAYAAALHIKVVPEIDVPGHSAAIIKAYPELGASHDVLNIGNPKTIEFLEKLFNEVADLFPGEYVHIGCDEVGHNAWKKNKDCIAKMKELGVKDTHGLHRWLVHHLQQHLAKKKKQSIAWCEVLDCDVKKEVVVMCWRDNNGWVKAPKKGHKIVVTPSMQTYFNYQEDVKSNAPGHGGYRTTMQKVYDFDPVDPSLTEKEKTLVLGGQGCIWTEYIRTPKEVEYIMFPRVAALSEALWTPRKNKDWNRYVEKLQRHKRYLQELKINYRVAAPVTAKYKVKFTDVTKVILENPNMAGNIYYTLDGTTPTRNSIRYEDGIEVREDVVITAIVIELDKPSYEIKVKCRKIDPNKATFKAKVETNMKSNGKHVAENALDDDDETMFWTNHPLTEKHYFTVKLKKATKAEKVEVHTGNNGKDILKAGNLEVTYDGTTYVKLADFTGGIAQATPEKAILGIRISVIRPQNEWMIIKSISIE